MKTLTQQVISLGYEGVSLLQIFSEWNRRQRTRKQLAEIPGFLLKDIGIDEAQRQQELSKGFWKK